MIIRMVGIGSITYLLMSIAITPRSYGTGPQNSGTLSSLTALVQRNSATLNDHPNIVNIGSSKVKNSSFKDKEQFFNSHMERNIFDSLHSYSKFSSLGGTHSIEKKRRRLKNTSSFKKKRGKPTSSKKGEKVRSSSGPFVEDIIRQNNRSVNLVSHNVKMANPKQLDTSKKRYQYHKRIHSDTGHNIINPLEHVYDKTGSIKASKDAKFSSTKAKTDVPTPHRPSDVNRASVIDHKLPINTIHTSTVVSSSGKKGIYDNQQHSKSLSTNANLSNTVNLNKYNFAPSFTYHKNTGTAVSLEKNVKYRKFKSNKQAINAHRIEGKYLD